MLVLDITPKAIKMKEARSLPWETLFLILTQQSTFQFGSDISRAQSLIITSDFNRGSIEGHVTQCKKGISSKSMLRLCTSFTRESETLETFNLTRLAFVALCTFRSMPFRVAMCYAYDESGHMVGH